MAARKDSALTAVVASLGSAGVSFALVHESALMGWGIDNNVILDSVDVLLLRDEDFRSFATVAPVSIGGFAEVEVGRVPARLWSRSSLGLDGPFDVTSCPRYGCEALAPELTLKKLAYSPDARMLAEQRARLASVLLASELSEDELSLVARYVRGD